MCAGEPVGGNDQLHFFPGEMFSGEIFLLWVGGWVGWLGFAGVPNSLPLVPLAHGIAPGSIRTNKYQARGDASEGEGAQSGGSGADGMAVGGVLAESLGVCSWLHMPLTLQSVAGGEQLGGRL